MIEEIKNKTLLFFREKKYHQPEDNQNQKEAFKSIESLNIPFDLDSDLRNYTHYTGVLIDFRADGKILDARKRTDNDVARSILEANGEIVTLFISFSDIDLYMRVFANKRFLNSTSELKVIEIASSDLNDAIRSQLNPIIEKIEVETGYKLLESTILSQKVDWLNQISEFEKVDFVPSIDDLVFGSFPLYAQLGI